MKQEDMKFNIINDEGKEVECEVLFTFESKETGKNYIVYTDNSLDEDGNTKVFASIYDPDFDVSKLLPVETEEEWAIIEDLFEELQKEASSEDEQSLNVETKISLLQYLFAGGFTLCFFDGFAHYADALQAVENSQAPLTVNKKPISYIGMEPKRRKAKKRQNGTGALC